MAARRYLRYLSGGSKKLARDRRAVTDCGLAKDYEKESVMAKVTLLKPEPTHVQIAHRAFEIYLSRGGEHGHDTEDWFEAERQLRTELQPKKRAVKRT